MRIYPVEWPGPGRLAVVSRPSPESIDLELAALRAAGYEVLVSLLSGPEATALGLRDEREACQRAGLAFEWHPIFDFSVPEGDCFREALSALYARFRQGAAVAAHCRGSLGRSPMLIASLMVLGGASPDDAWGRISRARGLPVPETDAQRQWVRDLVPPA